MNQKHPLDQTGASAPPTEATPTPDADPTRALAPLPLGGATTTAMPSRDLPTPSSALAIVAHPDDAEFLCGGTLAKWARDGCAIHHLVLTDGSKGTWDPHADLSALILARREEQLRAARLLGSSGKVVMLPNVDGELENSPAVRELIVRWIRELRPAVVLTHDPWKMYRLHPDHRTAGWLSLDAVVAARDPHFFPHLDLPHHRPDALLLFEAEQPNHVEDITGLTDLKVDALLAHRTQFVTTHGITEPDDLVQREDFRARVVAHATRVGGPSGVTEGEIFRLIDEL